MRGGCICVGKLRPERASGKKGKNVPQSRRGIDRSACAVLRLIRLGGRRRDGGSSRCIRDTPRVDDVQPRERNCRWRRADIPRRQGGGVRGIASRAWCSVRSWRQRRENETLDQVDRAADTEISGARAQLDFTSGKFQRVREDAERVMQLISAASDWQGADETSS